MFGLVIGAVLAVAAVTELLLFRRGSLRSLAQWYFDMSAPVGIRHLPFAGFPVAVFGVMVMLISLSVRVAITINVALLSVAMVLVIAAFAGSVWLVLMPPEWLKPAWLKQAEGVALAESIERERSEAVPVTPAEESPEATTTASPVAPAPPPEPVPVEDVAVPEESTVEPEGPDVDEQVPQTKPSETDEREPTPAPATGIIAANWGAPKVEDSRPEVEPAGTSGSSTPPQSRSFMGLRRKRGG
ncbi:MAG TPA: hypothetical protein VM784_05005 [Actinomycetota bacterium]|nr:hypothetical protein [Actinomycetota bacterium]